TPTPTGQFKIGTPTITATPRPTLSPTASPSPTTTTPPGGYRIYAYVTDAENKTISLGSKTIVANNASATKPFGTIDTPTQGEVVSGTINNFGWVLTPQPGSIATDGSTIVLYIDGIPQG